MSSPALDVDVEFVGVGVNRVVNSLCWGQHGGVAYAAHHTVAVYDVEVRVWRRALRIPKKGPLLLACGR